MPVQYHPTPQGGCNSRHGVQEIPAMTMFSNEEMNMIYNAIESNYLNTPVQPSSSSTSDSYPRPCSQESYSNVPISNNVMPNYSCMTHNLTQGSSSRNPPPYGAHHHFNTGFHLASVRRPQNAPTVPTNLLSRRPMPTTNTLAYRVGNSNGRVRRLKRYRTNYTTEEVLIFESEYRHDRYLERTRRQELSNMLCISEKKIKIWFQNRRMRETKEAKEKAEEEKNKVNNTIDSVIEIPMWQQQDHNCRNSKIISGPEFQGITISVPFTAVAGTSAAMAGPSMTMAGTSTAMTGTSATMAGTSMAVTGISTVMPGPSVAIAGTSTAVAGTSGTMAGTLTPIAGTSMAMPGTSTVMAGILTGIAGTSTSYADYAGNTVSEALLPYHQMAQLQIQPHTSTSATYPFHYNESESSLTSSPQAENSEDNGVSSNDADAVWDWLHEQN